MYQRIQASKKKEGGFTLIELLIVVVILGILAAVVIFASAGFANKGALEACRTNVSSVKTAGEAFHVDSPTAAFPANWGDVQPTYFDPNGVAETNVAGPPVVSTLTGKGWKFKVTWNATGPVASSGGGTAFAPPDPICTK